MPKFLSPIDAEGNQINDVADPTLAQDVATKNYIDSVATTVLRTTGAQTAAGAKTFTSPMVIDPSATGAPLTLDLFTSAGPYLVLSEGGVGRGEVYDYLDGVGIKTDTGPIYIGTGNNSSDIILNPHGVGSIDVSSSLIENVADPVSPQDAATKIYVDNIAQGLDAKQSVRWATTQAQNLATDFENGDTIDGQTLGTGNRILIKNQATASENGIYVINATGAPTRADDANGSGDLSGGAYVFVEAGTVNADTGWVLTNDGIVTIGVTGQVWTQFTGAGAIVGGAGLTKTGNTLDVGAGTGISVAADTVGIDTAVVPRKGVANTFTDAQTIDVPGALVALTLDVDASQFWMEMEIGGSTRGRFHDGGDSGLYLDAVAGPLVLNSASNWDVHLNPGGTGRVDVNSSIIENVTDPTAAQHAATKNYVDTAAARKFTQLLSTSATSYVITHNLNSRDVQVSVYRDTTPWDQVEVDVEKTSVNTVTLRFAVAPSANAYRVGIVG